MTYKVRCDVCEHEDFSTLYDMNGKYSIIRCRRCGLWRSYPILKKHEIGQLYEKYHEKWGTVGKDAEMHRAMRRDTFRRIFKILSRYKAPYGRLLDIGCGTGICMEVGKEFGWDVYGVDISEEAVASARAMLGSRVEALDFENAELIPASNFDVVIMTDVLEHLNDVTRTINSIHTILKPGGVALIVTVDTGSLFAKLMRNKWLFIHRQHLVYFSKKNLKLLLGRTGFEILKFQRSFKSTNLYYLGEYFGQKAEDLPRLRAVSRVIRSMVERLPCRARYFNFLVPTGDLMAIARKR